MRILKLYGKYEFHVDERTKLLERALRNGQEWPEGMAFGGSRAFMGLLEYAFELEDKLRAVHQRMTENYGASGEAGEAD